jgi:hypothetical protein
MNVRPTPLMMPKQRTQEQITAVLEPGSVVRPGTRVVEKAVTHDGVIKAKHLEAGMVVRAWVHGAPRGGVRVVKAVTKSSDGSTVTVEFSSPHPTTEYKAAYRFFVPKLKGTPVIVTTREPALVDYF